VRKRGLERQTADTRLDLTHMVNHTRGTVRWI